MWGLGKRTMWASQRVKARSAVVTKVVSGGASDQRPRMPSGAGAGLPVGGRRWCRRRVAGVEMVAGGVVDVHQEGVTAFGCPAAEGIVVGGKGEEVTVDDGAAGVGGQLCGEWEEAATVPVDHLVGGFDDVQGPHPAVVERGPGRVAEAETADDDVERGVRELGQGEGGEPEGHLPGAPPCHPASATEPAAPRRGPPDGGVGVLAEDVERAAGRFLDWLAGYGHHVARGARRRVRPGQCARAFGRPVWQGQWWLPVAAVT